MLSLVSGANSPGQIHLHNKRTLYWLEDPFCRSADVASNIQQTN